MRISHPLYANLTPQRCIDEQHRAAGSGTNPARQPLSPVMLQLPLGKTIRSIRGELRLHMLYVPKVGCVFPRARGGQRATALPTGLGYLCFLASRRVRPNTFRSRGRRGQRT